jgi:hypothetical protein
LVALPADVRAAADARGIQSHEGAGARGMSDEDELAALESRLDAYAIAIDMLYDQMRSALASRGEIRARLEKQRKRERKKAERYLGVKILREY